MNDEEFLNCIKEYDIFEIDGDNVKIKVLVGEWIEVGDEFPAIYEYDDFDNNLYIEMISFLKRIAEINNIDINNYNVMSMIAKSISNTVIYCKCVENLKEYNDESDSHLNYEIYIIEKDILIKELRKIQYFNW